MLTFSLLCTGRVLVDPGLPSVYFESCFTIDMLQFDSRLETPSCIQCSVTIESAPFSMWAEGPPASNSWHAQCVSRKQATDCSIFAGKDSSQILSNCPFCFMLCKFLCKCFHKILETFFDKSKNFMSTAK